MISEKEALDVAERYLADQCKAIEGGVAIVRHRTIRKAYGWIFFYDSQRYLETGSPLEALGGNGPLVVESSTGRVHALETALAPELAIVQFEQRNGLG